MKKLFTRTLIPWILTLCLVLGGVSFAGAEQTETSDFEALLPLLDLVASAAMTAGDEPEVIGNEETTLSAAYVSAFFNNGLTADASLNITADYLTDTASSRPCWEAFSPRSCRRWRPSRKPRPSAAISASSRLR
jgi:hypothetical protein